MIARVLIVITIFSATALASEWLSRPEPLIAREPLANLAQSLDGWSGTELPLDAKVLDTLGLDDHLSRVYERAGNPPVSLYIGFYKSQRTGQTIHSPLKCLPGTGWQPLQTGRVFLDVQGANGRAERIEVNRYVVQKGLSRHIVLFWYQMRGHVVASEYTAKLYLIDGAVRTNRTDGALVRVIVPVADGTSEAAADQVAASFVRMVFSRLEPHLPA
jgi:EpsI family protein